MKKKIIIVIIILVVLSTIGGISYFYLKKDKGNNYSISEQKWIDNNKNNNIDIYIPSDISALTASGKGVIFDYINSFSKNTGLKVNPIAYQLENKVNGDYSIQIVDKVTDDDIKLLTDEYILVSKNVGMISDSYKISNYKIGVLESEKDLVQSYLGNNVYVPYKTKELLLTALNNNQVQYIVGLKSLYLDDILENNLHISYHISDFNKYYVLKTESSNKELNSIFRKEFNKFEKNLNNSYNESLRNVYIKYNKISEQDLANLNSRKYTYGYVGNGIFDSTKRGKLTGTNSLIIKSFSSFADVDIKFDKEYSTIEKLNDALKDNKIDFYFDNSSYNSDTESLLPVTSKIVFLSKNTSKISINSLVSLKKYKVATIKDSKLEKLLKEKDISVITFKNYKEMFKSKKLTNNVIISIEFENYEYYKTRKLKNYHACYMSEESISYGYKVNDNELFSKLLNFYLEYIDLNSVIIIDYANVYEYEGLNIFLLLTVIILLFIFIFQFIGKIKRFIKNLLNHNNRISKEEKIKYIDSLTSLKNRTYLNDNIEKWDNSEIYPQIIVIVDLNNIAYINDNFGHEEGDKVITEAANILIQTQMPNTDIIRTDGNEFLIYMVDYEEKKAVAYIRKLNREFKNLTHGYGAAIGYSIINDAIKTIDDAVNEATLDMKTNKEIMMNEEK